MGAAKSSTELNELKEQAKTLGIQFSPNIGLEALKLKIQSHYTGLKEIEIQAAQNSVLPSVPKKYNDRQKRLAAIRDMTVLKRYEIHCLNASKSDLKGEFVTVGNTVTGGITRYIPFHGKPWHLPKFIVNGLNDRKYVDIQAVEDPATKIISPKVIERKEYELIELDPLGEEGLKKLAAEQAAGNRIGDD